MTIYNKLVRDKIPDIIRACGEEPRVRVLEDAEYIDCLEAKLDEEVGEYHKDKNADELADILEVLFALGAHLGVSEVELLALRNEKRQKRGGFSKRIFLMSKETVDNGR